MAPKISVIIPVYNVESYLDRCLTTVLTQTYENLEILLVDDASTDGSLELCAKYQKTDPRVKLIKRRENGGLSAARNSGLAHATGEYLTFVDSDDSIDTNYLATLYSALAKNSKLSICAVREIRPGKKILNSGTGYAKTYLSRKQALKRMLKDESFNVSAYAKLYHKSLWQNLKFPEGRIHEDLGTTYKTILGTPASAKIAYTPETAYNYIRRADSLSDGRYSPKKLDIIDLTDQMCADIDRAEPSLKNVTNLRRMHARFSVLRQLAFLKSPSPREAAVKKGIIAYLKNHKHYILKNPESNRRDRLAIKTLLLGEPIFKLSWRIYARTH